MPCKQVFHVRRIDEGHILSSGVHFASLSNLPFVALSLAPQAPAARGLGTGAHMIDPRRVTTYSRLGRAGANRRSRFSSTFWPYGSDAAIGGRAEDIVGHRQRQDDKLAAKAPEFPSRRFRANRSKRHA